MTSYAYVVADAFTDTPLCGNPVAVFTDADGLSAQDMQRIARELNLSETTFVFPPKGDGDYHVRIFTPVNELPFAGHPTLGTAVVLGGTHPKSELVMETGMGLVPFQLQRDAQGLVTLVTMEQPIPTWSHYELEHVLLEGLGLRASTLPVEVYRNGPRHVFVGLPSIADLSAVKPDLRVLAQLPDVATNCFAGSGSEWRMRMFSPAYGVAEDAATGSAAGPLALHLIRHGLVEFEQPVVIEQGVEMGRRSVMHATVSGTFSNLGPIRVSGTATIVAQGNLIRW
ncbi:PhzF family phenazine biosynthesis protein [Paraburkholderia phenazinium]|jgi:trans-2,3-dihydro-3-hydroxyanthranilate isomerase|uniref:Trans-2,3-dihydro-3-hydroxyanthranilate isomerase n=1 Tax=Paraburkholderia phenazinium TaxID=60549 RepID=A0A1G8JFV2_9BURK|nr:PhzF family phenazine biosynthesis protein [Paraburkholderia phenazinium]SDI30159.1 trans-2,3-dihydro-3-hydroxyanthranilate isomerase [Paraburkholderia phenazinium]